MNMTDKNDLRLITMGHPKDFASATGLLRSLIGARKLVKGTLQSREVAAAFDLVGHYARQGSARDRLEATSLLGKAGEVSKPVASIVRTLLHQALIDPLPAIGTWGNADDRYYLAKAIANGDDQAWIGPYAAKELAQAEASERSSRQVWAQIAVERAKSLTSVLEVIVNALSDDQKSPSSTVDGVTRKLNRTTAALMEILPAADVPLGEGFGMWFSRLVSQTTGRAGPESRALREETALNVLDLMVQILRLRFPATLESAIYQTAGSILSWWKPATPPQTVMDRVERIARIAMDSLHTLSRQGIRQDHLRQAMALSLGSELINRLGTELAANDPSLEPSMAAWLSVGRDVTEAKSSAAVRELVEQDLDELVGRLLLALDVVDGDPQTLRLLADSLEVLDPPAAIAARSAMVRVQIIAQWGRAIATKRALALRGRQGDLVRYDPALHDSHQNIEVSATARINSPAVIKNQEGLSPKVIIKAVVEIP
jgi:hypothetical protein